jgi:hypothetical protein
MNTYDDRPAFTPDELRAEFAALFPRGWAGPDVLADLAPDGWANAPLAAAFHPTVDQLYEEQVRVHRNMAAFPRKPDAPPPPPEPTRAEVAAEYEAAPVEPERECQELVGRCLWDVFSDNHEVVAADGRWLHLGSARGSGGFLAEVVNAQGGPAPPPKPDLSAMMDSLFPPSDNPAVAAIMADMRKEMVGDGGYTYLDFYMGTGSVAGRADLRPVYELIFRRLRSRGHDWVYHFPRLYAVDFRPLKKQLDEQGRGEPEWSGYDPAAAMEEEQAERKRDEEVAALRESLDEGHREAVAAALDAEPPAVVRAYAAVYGEFPDGWPPEA